MDVAHVLTSDGAHGSRKRKGCIIGGHLECNYLHPPSISIPLCGRVLRCYVVETASYYEERLYGTPNLLSLSFVIDDRFSTRAPLSANLRFSAPLSTRECDDRISRPRLHAHATINRRRIDASADDDDFESRRSSCQIRYRSLSFPKTGLLLDNVFLRSKGITQDRISAANLHSPITIVISRDGAFDVIKKHDWTTHSIALDACNRNGSYSSFTSFL